MIYTYDQNIDVVSATSIRRFRANIGHIILI